MRVLTNIFVAFVAVEHFGIMILEMFLWDHPVGRKVFAMTPEVSAISATLAANRPFRFLRIEKVFSTSVSLT